VPDTTPDELRTLAERVRSGIAWLPPVDRTREADDALRLAEAVLAFLTPPQPCAVVEAPSTPLAWEVG